MGWLFYRREPGTETNAEHFSRKLGDRSEIVAHGTVDHVFYAAVRDRDTGKVSAYVALTRWTREDLNFGYKDMDETAGPGDCKAPTAVLQALTETTNEYALQWRANCRRYHDQRGYLRKHLKPGMRVRLTHALRFNNDTRHDTFTYVRSGGNGQGGLIHGSNRYQVPHWRDNVAALIHTDGSEALTPVGEHHKATTTNTAPTPGSDDTPSQQAPRH
ncbi:hypothetical protein ABZ468_50150 [Streptomyces sp. NPDC005708]|uniref:DUF6927 domain-containing protein n=1 Tax=Streptomyces sp. NPDC005708 TaxID=3154564 RepID=UPI0033E5C4A8